MAVLEFTNDRIKQNSILLSIDDVKSTIRHRMTRSSASSRLMTTFTRPCESSLSLAARTSA
ncbi:hypothetical protein CSC17_3689 [Klebsiella oxytoca]|nr:hypothetical protein CSC17_3689 [Klebsiella oxytoca]